MASASPTGDEGTTFDWPDALQARARDAALKTVTALARQAIPQCAGASLTVIDGDEPRTAAWSGDVSKEADDKQYEFGMSPCLAAIERASVVRVESPAAAEEWPPVADTYRALGLQSSLSIPVPRTGAAVLPAALNLYSSDTGAFEGELSLGGVLARETARVLEEHAASAESVPIPSVAAAFKARDVLLQVGAVLVSEQTLDEVLQLITTVAQRSLGTAEAASVTLAKTGGAYTSNSTAPLAVELDDVQYATGGGPCLHALATAQRVNAPMAASEAQWPALAEAALSRGVGCVLAVPFVVRGEAIGVLNVYGAGRSSFTAAEEETADLLARQGAVVLANAMAFGNARALNEQLWEALDTRDLIGQAKGIVMARDACSADAAFDVLRRASQRTNRKLRDVAIEVVRATERPATGS